MIQLGDGWSEIISNLKVRNSFSNRVNDTQQCTPIGSIQVFNGGYPETTYCDFDSMYLGNHTIVMHNYVTKSWTPYLYEHPANTGSNTTLPYSINQTNFLFGVKIPLLWEVGKDAEFHISFDYEILSSDLEESNTVLSVYVPSYGFIGDFYTHGSPTKGTVDWLITIPDIYTVKVSSFGVSVSTANQGFSYRISNVCWTVGHHDTWSPGLDESLQYFKNYISTSYTKNKSQIIHSTIPNAESKDDYKGDFYTHLDTTFSSYFEGHDLSERSSEVYLVGDGSVHDLVDGGSSYGINGINTTLVDCIDGGSSFVSTAPYRAKKGVSNLLPNIECSEFSLNKYSNYSTVYSTYNYKFIKCDQFSATNSKLFEFPISFIWDFEDDELPILTWFVFLKTTEEQSFIPVISDNSKEYEVTSYGFIELYDGWTVCYAYTEYTLDFLYYDTTFYHSLKFKTDSFEDTVYVASAGAFILPSTEYSSDIAEIIKFTVNPNSEAIMKASYQPTFSCMFASDMKNTDAPSTATVKVTTFDGTENSTISEITADSSCYLKQGFIELTHSNNEVLYVNDPIINTRLSEARRYTAVQDVY